eukprot:TRINITY_DN17683_c0_g3_i2.p1 TRINITY_DN17683_c0_g3~~TRINITY_DN17683_c0_g3_i2.p1  ORF type:complete len:233 (-),score=59.44 TRINITY_DN17683_c0_g3_i2:55-753(-)
MFCSNSEFYLFTYEGEEVSAGGGDYHPEFDDAPDHIQSYLDGIKASLHEFNKSETMSSEKHDSGSKKSDVAFEQKDWKDELLKDVVDLSDDEKVEGKDDEEKQALGNILAPESHFREQQVDEQGQSPKKLDHQPAEKKVKVDESLFDDAVAQVQLKGQPVGSQIAEGQIGSGLSTKSETSKNEDLGKKFFEQPSLSGASQTGSCLSAKSETTENKDAGLKFLIKQDPKQSSS